jgi:hypothetical protein
LYVMCPSISSGPSPASIRRWCSRLGSSPVAVSGCADHLGWLGCCEPLAGRRSTALIHRWRPSAPRARPHHSRRSFTHQSSLPALDQVAGSAWIGGSSSRRSASACWCRSSSTRTAPAKQSAAGFTSRRLKGQGQVELVSDVNANQWFMITAERIPGKRYRWYVNGGFYKQSLLRDLRQSLRGRRHEGAGIALHRSTRLPPLADSVRV